jgi:antitoxin (DNA-binding transcriptional repressor) of toxin-antitoxin stability system
LRTVGVKVLKNELGEYLQLVAGGERVLITDRGRIVAEIRASDVAGVRLSDALLADAVRNLWVSVPLLTRAEPPTRLPVAPTDAVLAQLAADRD